MGDAMPFCQTYQHRTAFALKDVIHDQFFMPLRSQLYAGDSITLCRFDRAEGHRRDARLLEFATVRVVASSPGAQAVPLVLVGDIVAVPGPDEPAEPVEAAGQGKGKRG